jgi:hypothetical protein
VTDVNTAKNLLKSLKQIGHDALECAIKFAAAWQVKAGDICTCLCQSNREALTNAAACASDKSDLMLEVNKSIALLLALVEQPHSEF